MNISLTSIAGLKIISPKVLKDPRGYFFESYNKNDFHNHDIMDEFIQDNESFSQKGVVRGLHFQNPPHAQAKLVRVIKGAVLDVAVDLRKKSLTYGHHFSIILTEENKTMLYIPIGFGHGFSVLEDQTIFSYKCSAVYNKESERVIMWNDSLLAIDWKVSKPIISEKDSVGIPLNVFQSNF